MEKIPLWGFFLLVIYFIDRQHALRWRCLIEHFRILRIQFCQQRLLIVFTATVIRAANLKIAAVEGDVVI